MTSSFRKGDLITIDALVDWGDMISSIHPRPIFGYVQTTPADREDYYRKIRESGDTLDSAGEPRLAPVYTLHALEVGCLYIVLRARAAPSWKYRLPKIPGGMCLILCTKTGREIYAWRQHMRAADQKDDSNLVHRAPSD